MGFLKVYQKAIVQPLATNRYGILFGQKPSFMECFAAFLWIGFRGCPQGMERIAAAPPIAMESFSVSQNPSTLPSGNGMLPVLVCGRISGEMAIISGWGKRNYGMVFGLQYFHANHSIWG